MDSNQGRNEKKIHNPYFSLSLGAIGMLLLTFGIFKLVIGNVGTNPADFFLPCAGLIILIHYIILFGKESWHQR